MVQPARRQAGPFSLAWVRHPGDYMIVNFASGDGRGPWFATIYTVIAGGATT